LGATDYRPTRTDGSARKPIGNASTRPKGHKANHAKAVERANYYTDVLADLRQHGIVTKAEIAKELTLRGIITPGGSTKWQTVQVQRILDKLDE
jgi:hypothetical protein